MGRLVFLWILILHSTLLFAQSDTPKVNPKVGLPDLTIDTIRIIEKKRLFSFLKPRFLYLEYTIKNIGASPASLLGKKKSPHDNIAVRAYFSGDRKLNKGDFLADGTPIPNDFSSNGELPAGASFTGKMKVSLQAKTKYIGVLILKIDDFSELQESDETNNTFWHILK